VGGRKNLQRWMRLAGPLDYEGVRRVLSRWDGYAGLVYFRLLLDRLAESGDVERVSEAQAFRSRDVESRPKPEGADPVGRAEIVASCRES
jgi:hypothetical protein